MNCPGCKAAVSPDAKFCSECGTALEQRCPGCGASQAARAKFCSQCGHRFAAEAPPRREPTRPLPAVAAPVPDAERRQLTVLFSDLAGSTELSKRLDAEDFREVLRTYHEAVQAVIARFSGHVAQFLGDGVLVYFGYPLAHEDDAQRSILAGLGIVDAMAAVSERFQRERDVKLAVRVGIHTGPTVVGPVGSANDPAQLAMGSTPNVAAAIQTAAAPGTVVASAATVRLVRGSYQCDPLGPRTIKAGVEPMELYRMRHLPRIATRVDLSPLPTQGSLVGRGLEMGLLTGRWAETRTGRGRLVLVSGDAGIGKSRLVQGFRDAMKEDAHRWLEGRCSPYHADSALRPLAEVVTQLAEIPDESGVEAALAALEKLLARLGLASSAAITLLGGLLGYDVADPPALAGLPPQVRRGRMLELLLSVLLKSAEERPLVLMLEDMHWVDQSTVDFIALLTERMARVPIFLLLTARPEFRPSWSIDAEISLRRLPRDEAERMVSALAGDRALLADVMAHIVERSDGNPLFVEELTKMVIESGQLPSGGGADGAGALAVPTTLHDSLMARLDRLGPVKVAAQLAATIGRQFSFAQLAELSGAGEADLRRDVAKLLEAEIIYGRGAPPFSQYTFKHALVQEAAYGSLTRKTRRLYHERLCQQLGAKPGTAPEVLAHHFSEAGHPREAVRHWLLAGQRALGAFALVESIHHLERGLAVAREQLGGSDSVSAELDVRLVLGVPLMLTRGFAAPEVEAHYQRVFELCRQVQVQLGEGESGQATAQLFPAYWGLWTFYEVSANYPKAEEMGTRLLELGERVQDTGIRLAGYTAHAAALLMRGRLAEARDEFEKALAIYEMPTHKALANLFGQDAAAMCAAFLTWVHAHRGDDAAADRCARQAVDLYERIGHPGTEGFVECVLASFRSVAGDFEAAELHARRVMALAEQQGMPHWAAQGRANLGWAMQGRGLAVEGAEHIRAGLASLGMIGTRAAFTYFEGALAAAELRAGHAAEAREVLARAFAFAESSGEHFYLAELHRLEGEALLASGEGRAAVERAFREAVAVAHAQGAEAFVRRAERSLRALAARTGQAAVQ
jgi:predicted ATPase/class 3 adenylate cyclase